MMKEERDKHPQEEPTAEEGQQGHKRRDNSAVLEVQDGEW